MNTWQTAVSEADDEIQEFPGFPLPDDDAEWWSPKRPPTNLRRLLFDFVLAIRETIPVADPITILGRDLWLLVPILRTLEYNVHYFIWSRIQGVGYKTKGEIRLDGGVDALTRYQWLREVHPSSWVLDTGFAGSIFNAIQVIDQRIDPRKMRLMSSASKDYEPLGENRNHNDVIDHIEHIEKLSPRGASYSQEENVIWARKDKKDSGKRTSSVKTLAERNYQTLLDLGCSEEVAIEYATFTGSTPRERLGMNAEQRQIHYRIVSEARRRYSPIQDEDDEMLF